PALVLANLESSGEQKLATRRFPEVLGWGPLQGPAWSPDGREIAIPVLTARGEFAVLAEPVRGQSGTEKSIGSQRWSWIYQPAWLPDGRALVITASTLDSPVQLQIYELLFPDGEIRKITQDLNSYTGVSLTADGNALTTVQDQMIADVWVAPKGSAGTA